MPHCSKWSVTAFFSSLATPAFSNDLYAAAQAPWFAGGAALAIFGIAGFSVLRRRPLIDQAAANSDVYEKLGDLMDAVHNGIVGLCETGEIAFINNKARDILGGVTDPVPFAWPTSVRIVEPAPIGQTGDITNTDWGTQIPTLMTRLDKSGKLVTLRATSSPAHDGDFARLLVLEDISSEEQERQRGERASRLDALGQLTGGIAHDFNNLLAMIEYGIQLADKEKRADKRCMYHSAALTSVRRGVSLTNRLLAFAKKQPGLAKSHAIEDVFAEFSQLAKPAIEEAIELQFDYDPANLWINCDLAQLENALLNLVLNSRDAIMRSSRGGLISVRAREAEDGAIELSVTDNGPGMTDEVKKKATDPFYTTKEHNAGTGLGLSMVYGFVSQSAGEMSIQSSPGSGTTVRLTLPSGTPSPDHEAAIDFFPKPRGQGQNVLLVEDEDSLLEILTDVVTSLGYNVVAANSASEALRQLDSNEPFDLLMTDVVMPKMGGFQLASEARRTHPSLPVLYMSGYTGFSEAEMGKVVAPLVKKPCSPNELADAMETALEIA